MNARLYHAILIDPEFHRIDIVETDGSHEQTKQLVRAQSLGHFRIADHDTSWDYGWVDDNGLLGKGRPVHAFKFSTSKDPLSGRCLLVGVDKDRGNVTDVKIPMDFLRQHIEWLGQIVPEVTWEETEGGHRVIVTYTKVGNQTSSRGRESKWQSNQ